MNSRQSLLFSVIKHLWLLFCRNRIIVIVTIILAIRLNDVQNQLCSLKKENEKPKRQKASMRRQEAVKPE